MTNLTDTHIPNPIDPGFDPSHVPDERRTTAVILGTIAATLVLLGLGAVVGLLVLRDGSPDVDESTVVVTEVLPADAEDDVIVDESTTETTLQAEEEPPTETTVAETESATATTVAVSDSTSEAVLTFSENPLTLRGMGPVLFGMTIPEAEALLGVDFSYQVGTPTECDFAFDASDPDSPLFMIVSDNGDIETGTIVAIYLGEKSLTDFGIGFGATKAEVIAAYGGGIVASPHPYGGSAGSEYLTYTSADDVNQDYRMIFETSDDLVTAIRSGTVPFVEWQEGCA